jgi:phosphatidylserine synthase
MEWFKKISGWIEFSAIVIVTLYFFNEGLEFVDLESILNNTIRLILLVLVAIGGLSMLVRTVMQLKHLRLKKDKSKLPSNWMLILMLLFSVFLLYLPIRITDDLFERIFIYFIFIIILIGGGLHRYFESRIE